MKLYSIFLLLVITSLSYAQQANKIQQSKEMFFGANDSLVNAGMTINDAPLFIPIAKQGLSFSFPQQRSKLTPHNKLLFLKLLASIQIPLALEQKKLSQNLLKDMNRNHKKTSLLVKAGYGSTTDLTLISVWKIYAELLLIKAQENINLIRNDAIAQKNIDTLIETISKRHLPKKSYELFVTRLKLTHQLIKLLEQMKQSKQKEHELGIVSLKELLSSKLSLFNAKIRLLNEKLQYFQQSLITLAKLNKLAEIK